MSQAKVDKYKEAKAHRKETMKKEKTASMIRKVVAAVVAVVVIGWAGYSAYNAYTTYQPNETVEIDYSAIENIAAEEEE